MHDDHDHGHSHTHAHATRHAHGQDDHASWPRPPPSPCRSRPQPRAPSRAAWRSGRRRISARTRRIAARAGEADLDQVEAAFVEGFLAASDPTSFLRLAGIPFKATARGRREAGPAARRDRGGGRCRLRDAASRRRIVPLRSAAGAARLAPAAAAFRLFRRRGVAPARLRRRARRAAPTADRPAQPAGPQQG